MISSVCLFIYKILENPPQIKTIKTNGKGRTTIF